MKTGRKGFTLVEILVVVVIVGVVLALAIVAYLPHLRRANALKNIGNVRSVATAVDQYYASPTITGSLPITFPAASVTYTGGTPAYAAYATLDHVLSATGFLPQPLHWMHAAADWVPSDVPVRYDPTTRAFVDTGSFNAALATQPTPCHLVCRLSTPATLPSAAAGGNFRLNGTDDLPANALVVSAILPNTPQLDAAALAEQLLPADQQPGAGAACNIGKIAYAASDAAGLTTVYLYVSHR